MEIWVDITGYENRYRVSDCGRVLSLKKRGRPQDKILNGCRDGKKYHYVMLLSSKNQYKMHKIHRLVATHFIPNPENKPQVNHIDGRKENNSVSNLEWVTNSENVIHAFKNGLSKSGEKHFNSKMTRDSVSEMRSKYAAGGSSYRKLSREYGIAHQVVAMIILRKTWKHI